jgi:exonuclease V gamma subunit
MSVVVSELMEVIGAGVGRQPVALAVEHPLQPWSERAFDDDRRRPFDNLWVAAATARGTRVDTGLAATKPGRRWPEEEHPLDTLTAEQLASALAYPQKELLGKRLGLGFGREDDTLADREPLTSDQLDDWVVRDRALRASGGGVEMSVDLLESRLRGEGLLPLSAAGRAALEGAVEEAREAQQQARRVPGVKQQPLQLSWNVEGTTMVAVASDPREQGADLRLVWLTASRTPNARLQLLSWITLLIATASGGRVRSAHLAACESSMVLRAPRTAEEAQAHLAKLVATRRRVRQDLVPLFPKLSRELLVQRAKSPAAEPARLVTASVAKWEGGGFGAPPGDRKDAWVEPLYGHLTIDDLALRADELLGVATDVWGPLLDAERRARAEET